MAYYQIKCPCCSSIATNETVLFDITNAFKRTRDLMAETSTFSHVTSETPVQADRVTERVTERIAPERVSTERKTYRNLWDDEDDEPELEEEFAEAPAAAPVKEAYEQPSVQETSDLMTFSQIQEYCKNNGFPAPSADRRSVNVTADCVEKGLVVNNGDLIMAVTFQKEKGGAVLRADDRYCPACHCMLPTQAGQMPTYVITMMGTSSSGKTVYLCALNWVLVHNYADLPYGGRLSGISASDTGATIEGFSIKMFQDDILPGTTTQLFNDPIVLQITYDQGGKKKNCLLALNDMRGEDLAYTGRDHLRKRAESFANADGFIMVISPLNIPNVADKLRSSKSRNTGDLAHTQLIQSINNYILRDVDGRTINKPCVILLSKADILSDNVERLGIPRWNAAVAPDPDLYYTKTYFANQDKGARRIIAADEMLYVNLNQIFKSPYYVSVSSVGRGVVIDKDEDGNIKIMNHNVVNPFRVIDPVLRMLIKLGFLPEYDEMEGGKPFDADNEKYLANWVNSHI